MIKNYIKLQWDLREDKITPTPQRKLNSRTPMLPQIKKIVFETAFLIAILDDVENLESEKELELAEALFFYIFIREEAFHFCYHHR
jgi:hypothetical protein